MAEGANTTAREPRDPEREVAVRRTFLKAHYITRVHRYRMLPCSI